MKHFNASSNFETMMKAAMNSGLALEVYDRGSGNGKLAKQMSLLRESLFGAQGVMLNSSFVQTVFRVADFC